MTYAVRPIDLADDAHLRRAHEIMWRATREDGRAWTSMWSLERMTLVLREPVTGEHLELLGAYDGEALAGLSFVFMSLQENLGQVYADVYVEPERRRRGIGSALADGVVTLTRAAGRTTITAEASYAFDEAETAAALRFATRHGFTTANLEINRQLDLPVDPALLEELRRGAAPYHQDYEIRTFTGIPPEPLLPSYAHLINQLALDAPSGDLELEEGRTTPEILHEHQALRERAGQTFLVSVAIQDGQVVAHSDLLVPQDGDHMIQDATLVHRDHRGRRLGTAVKVANLAVAQAAFPARRRINTTNAETNQQMIDINEALGFRPVALCPAFQRVLKEE